METYHISDWKHPRSFNKTVVVLKEKEVIDTHSHPGNREEITVLAGLLRVRHCNTSKPMEEGDTLMIEAKEDHFLTAVGGTAVFISKVC